MMSLLLSTTIYFLHNWAALLVFTIDLKVHVVGMMLANICLGDDYFFLLKLEAALEEISKLLGDA